MESNIIESEFECLICMDILLEPVTTICGHTFCRYCLIQYLKENKNCPLCRKPIFQSVDNLSKNIILENIIKKKYPSKYEKKQKDLSLALEKINKESRGKHKDVPTIFIEQLYVWPNLVREIKFKKNTNRLDELSNIQTIQLSSINNSILVVIPKNYTRDVTNLICNVCEIIEFKVVYENEIEMVVCKLKGLKRIKISDFKVLNSMFFSSGEIIIDNNIENDDIKLEIINKLKDIKNYNNCLLKDLSTSTFTYLKKEFGDEPVIPNELRDYSINKIESISFYYLNIIRSNIKHNLYEKTNPLERVNFIYKIFKEKVEKNEVNNMPFIFYDVKGMDYSKNNIKFLIFMLIILLLAWIGNRYGKTNNI